MRDAKKTPIFHKPTLAHFRGIFWSKMACMGLILELREKIAGIGNR
jgi:hypothetical protein